MSEEAEVKAPVDFETVIVCDLIRQENNGKHILVGVYGISIGLPGLPADIRLSWWMVAKPRSLGQHSAEFRITGPNDTILIRGQLSMNIKDLTKNFVLRLDNIPIQFQSAGKIRFEIQFPGFEWTLLKEMDVRLRTPRVLSVNSSEPAGTA